MPVGKDARRTQRMGSLVRAELARVLLEEVSDPTLKDLVITELELSKDLKHATVYFSTHGEVSAKQEKEIHKGLQRAMSFFRRKIGENLKLRYVPTFTFNRDKHGESMNRLLHLIETVEKEDESKKEIS